MTLTINLSLTVRIDEHYPILGRSTRRPNRSVLCQAVGRPFVRPHCDSILLSDLEMVYPLRKMVRQSTLFQRKDGSLINRTQPRKKRTPTRNLLDLRKQSCYSRRNYMVSCRRGTIHRHRCHRRYPNYSRWARNISLRKFPCDRPYE